MSKFWNRYEEVFIQCSFITSLTDILQRVANIDVYMYY